jgi:tellurite methyltransferase
MVDVQDKWNRKYRDKLNNLIRPEPNGRLVQLAPYLKGGTAIDFASGLGGNSMYLAEKGYKVTAFDISDVAINYLQEQTAGTKLDVQAKVADLTKDSNVFTSQKYDVAILTYYLDRSLFPLIKEVIRKDGYLFFETFYENGTTVNQHISNTYKLKSNELLSEFKEWKILFFEENEQEGRQTIFCQNTQNFENDL